MQICYTFNINFAIIWKKNRGERPLKIDWKLISDDEIIIDEKDKVVKIEQDIIYYEDEYGMHSIDQNRKIYERKGPEDIFKIDFNQSLLIVSFDNFRQKYDIITNYEKIDNVIRLTYALGNEKKIIEITRKEDI